MSLPKEAKERKQAPIFSGVLNYFPDAIVAVAQLSFIGNEQHNPGTPLHWDRSKSGDEKDALMRHLLESGTIDTDGVRHSTKVAWRALANLQKEIEVANAKQRKQTIEDTYGDVMKRTTTPGFVNVQKLVKDAIEGYETRAGQGMSPDDRYQD